MVYTFMNETRRGSEALGRRVRDLRLSQGMSLRTLAGLAGLSPMGLSYLERGERRVRASTLARVVQALGRADLLDELRQLAGEALVVVDRHPRATSRRERRRDRRAERFREARQWRAVWRKLGVRVRLYPK